MRRREFVTLLGGAATAWPLAARAQQRGKVSLVAYVSPFAGRSSLDEAFEDGLQQLGWVRGRNIRIEYRYGGGRQDTFSPLVSEVVALGLDALVTIGSPLSLAAKRASTQIPLVFFITFDPVDIGLVSNLARPGGNITGVTGLATDEIFAKHLELTTKLVPSVARIAVLLSTEQTRFSGAKDALETAAKVLHLELYDLEVHAPSELEGAIRNAKDQGIQALYIWPNGFNFSFAKQISEIANANRLPSIYLFREGALAGGLLAYGADTNEGARRVAAYVDKILRGTPPGTLPVEQLSKYKLLINLKTAKALGLDVPPSLLALADEAIE
jgi:putative tryptophan/tyrosine transport system substrate-binding protein